MKLADEKRIAAPRQAVWEGLNDPDILQQAIPGCESLEKTSETGFAAEVRAKVGPVKAKFKGQVELSDLNPPESYRISGEGKGGAAGFAKGGATVTLVEDGDGTILKYEVDADVGGKLAQIGGRLVEGTAKKLAGEFFDNFEKAVAPETDEAEEDADMAAPAETAPIEPEVKPAAEPSRIVTPEGGKTNVWWIVGVVFVVGALVLTLLR